MSVYKDGNVLEEKCRAYFEADYCATYVDLCMEPGLHDLCNFLKCHKFITGYISIVAGLFWLNLCNVVFT